SSLSPIAGPPAPTASPTALATPTRTPTATPTPPPQGNFALDFDGSNDEARGPQIAGTTGTQTIEVWVRPDTNNQNGLLLVNANANSGWTIELKSEFNLRH
ncbi:MAG TPA: hypothetical protein VFO07_11250, partial [Roseiflexaceae bacterium]|nr:hypothetical protein [Roseiflexaceae bacterium]